MTFVKTIVNAFHDVKLIAFGL